MCVCVYNQIFDEHEKGDIICQKDDERLFP